MPTLPLLRYIIVVVILFKEVHAGETSQIIEKLKDKALCILVGINGKGKV